LPPTAIAIDVVPYQGQISLTDNLTNAAAEMSFINDGYTILVVSTGAVTPTLTIYSVPDDIPGTENITGALVANKINIYGPFQPLFWNVGGSVQLTLSSATSVQVACFKLQF
jgi:hypothetical protein